MEARLVDALILVAGLGEDSADLVQVTWVCAVAMYTVYMFCF